MKLMHNIAAVAVLVASFAATAQSIPAPAGSTDSGVRAVVGITPVDLSGYATKTDVNNVANTAYSAYSTAVTANSTANTAYNTAVSANSTANSAYNYGYSAYTNQGWNRPWSQAFAGQTRYACGDPGCMYAYLDGNGYLSWRMSWSSYWVAAGYPGNMCVPITASSFPGTYVACPSSFDYYGRPTDWSVTYSNVIYR
ncbi:alanine-zipper protein [Ramlibacter sp. AN1133]|uniref:alanine-zipper protein n=1 Tax=Ramlibacter sp. AN1133 TaxID=3133429 RepID=UPI0030C5C814